MLASIYESTWAVHTMTHSELRRAADNERPNPTRNGPCLIFTKEVYRRSFFVKTRHARAQLVNWICVVLGPEQDTTRLTKRDQPITNHYRYATHDGPAAAFVAPSPPTSITTKTLNHIKTPSTQYERRACQSSLAIQDNYQTSHSFTPR